ncbi:molybdopterin-dependent oxidoreductase [candidate division KSB1 bacterium]|nr:molybdopterin-dependent oxidoreductase [candidate division KSB1 bacterium]
MATQITRRDWLKLAGGSVLGLMLSPVPWKLVDDAAIWTQNWPWMPTPLTGNFQTKFTNCTLCPAGCAVRARCVGDQPVSLWGVSDHPLSHGALCAVGLAGHHFAYHPLRLMQPCQRTGATVSPVAFDDALAAIANAITKMQTTGSPESVAVLDAQPERTMSYLYRRFLAALPHGLYLTPPAQEGATLRALHEMCEQPQDTFGFDFENARTILSFGAPLLDGWGTPGRMAQLIKNRQQTDLRIIQAETRQSHTALQAEEWLPIKPGTEAALALGIAHVLIHERLYDEAGLRRSVLDFDNYLQALKPFTTEQVAEVCGISANRISQLARMLAKRKPCVVIGDGDPAAPLSHETERAIAGLNVLLGSVSCKGGIVSRRNLPMAEEFQQQALAPATEIDRVPDHSIRVLILDAAASSGATPWALLAKKLVPKQSMVVSLAPVLGEFAGHIDYFIPAPAIFETWQDVPTAFDASTASFSLSRPLLIAPAGAIEPAFFLYSLAAAAGVAFNAAAGEQSLTDFIQHRVAAIYENRRGKTFNVQSREFVELAAISSFDELWQLLAEGGCWLDEAHASNALPRLSFLKENQTEGRSRHDGYETALMSHKNPTEAFPLRLMPFGWRGAMANHQVSPVLTKLFQESELRPGAQHACIHPNTAKEYGLVDGGSANISTPIGAANVRVQFDEAAMPGVIHVALGPAPFGFAKDEAQSLENILSVCMIEEDATWRVTPAKVQRV